jgi:hypothetical protein
MLWVRKSERQNIKTNKFDSIGGADGDRTRDLLTASSIPLLKTQDLRVSL